MMFQGSQITLIDYSKTPAQRLQDRRFTGPYHFIVGDQVSLGFHLDDNGNMGRGSAADLRLVPASEYYPAMTTYAIDDGSTEIQPMVALLPHGRGYLAAWSMGTNMAGGMEPEIYETAYDAASAAQDLAWFIASRENELAAEFEDQDDFELA